VNDLNTKVTGVSGPRRRTLLKGGFVAGTLLAFAGISQAQVAAPADDALTMKGITLYGIVDIGLQYESHGAPFSDYFPAGSADIVQKNSNNSQVGATPSNLSQSRVGLQGIEPLVGDWSGVFKVETFFNPQSGEISDALKSLTQNNGRVASCAGVTPPCSTQTTNLDSSIAGQLFEQSIVGIASPTFGSFTFGRQNTLLADGIAKYDAQGASQAFSLIGLSGTTAGGGDTQDRRLDSSLKYIANFSGFHLGALYKFNGASGSASTGEQAQVGYEFAGASIDAYYAHINDAVSASALSAAQLAMLPAMGLAPDKSLAATISDNTAFGIMANYSFGAPKVFAGYEHIRYANPTDPLESGADDIGGYKLAVVNNAAFPNDKILQVYWAGVKFAVNSSFDLTAAYYGYSQNAYGSGANAGCSTTKSGTCSGTESAVSFSADYRFHEALRRLRRHHVDAGEERARERLRPQHLNRRSDDRSALEVLGLEHRAGSHGHKD
jgi:predicted porin